MMQKLLINTPFTEEPASASELIHRAVPLPLPPVPFTERPKSLLHDQTFVYQNTHQNAHTTPTQAHTPPDVHQHQAGCCLPPTETYPVFIMACLFLKACSEPLKANQTVQKGNLCIKLFTDRCLLTVGRGVGSLGKRCCLKQQSVPDGIPGSINPWRAQKGFPFLPQLVSHLYPGDPFCLPSFCHCLCHVA